MNSVTDFKPITLPDLLREKNFPDEKIKAIMKLEKIRLQRTRAANKGVLKMAADYYNKTHKGSKLEVISNGILVEYKTNDN